MQLNKGGERAARGADWDGVWDLPEARLRVHARVEEDRERASGWLGSWTLLHPHSQVSLWRRLGGDGSGSDWKNIFAKNHRFLQVIYAGDSAADELAMEVLRGVAYSFKVNILTEFSGFVSDWLRSIETLLQVINEDTSALTKTWANARLQGPDAVQTMLK